MLKLRRLVTLFSRAGTEYFDDYGNHLAAGVSYYVIFAIFPMLFFVATMVGLLLQDPSRQEDFLEAVIDSTPVSEGVGADELADLIGGLGEASNGLVGLVSIVLAAWSASSLFAAIRNSLNAAFDVEYRKPYVPAKLFDLLMVLGLAPFFMASMALTAVLAFARGELADTRWFAAIADNAMIWWAVGVLVSGAFSFIAFFLLLIYAPACHVAKRDTWFAALVTCVAFEVAKGGLGVYLARVGEFDPIFGALGAGAVFLIWVNLSARILIFGGELASLYPRMRAGEFDPDPNAPKVPLIDQARNVVRGFFVRSDSPKT